MNIYILFAHPSKASFCNSVLEAFTRGVEEAGHIYTIGNLYEMGFKTDMDAEQYEREVGANPDAPVPDDVQIEQGKINHADALAFIYPVWWSDCPAKLKGWFDRVLTHGYAYLNTEDDQRSTRIDIQKAIVICPAGHTTAYLEKTGIAESMRKIMLHDRLLGVGVAHAYMEILGGMMPNDDSYREQNLKIAYDCGRNF